MNERTAIEPSEVPSASASSSVLAWEAWRAAALSWLRRVRRGLGYWIAGEASAFIENSTDVEIVTDEMIDAGLDVWIHHDDDYDFASDTLRDIYLSMARESFRD